MQRRALYLALGVTLDGDRDVLGMWFQETEGAKFWMQVLTELKQRGVQDILICCVDGLTGFPEAIEAIFPRTTVQTCVVHLIRASLKYVPRREREQVARDLKPIYTAVDADQAQAELETFDEKWGTRFPVITQAWLNAWEYVIPFLAFPAEVRRVIYTTNAIATSAKARWRLSTRRGPIDLSLPDLKRRSPSSPPREHQRLHRRDEPSVLHHVPGLDSAPALCRLSGSGTGPSDTTAGSVSVVCWLVGHELVD